MGQSYKDLIAWQKAMDLVENIYQVTGSFPKTEMFGITSQMRRAAVSIPSNIAEGQGRLSNLEFRQFLSHSLGSMTELETQVLISYRLRYMDETKTKELVHAINEIGRIVNGLISSINQREKSKRKNITT